MKVITVVKMREARADYKITLIQDGRQIKANEVRGDAGQAAAEALNLSAKNGGCSIIAPDDVKKQLNITD